MLKNLTFFPIDEHSWDEIFMNRRSCFIQIFTIMWGLTLYNAKTGQTVTMREVKGKEENFLFSFWCYEGEQITLISNPAVVPIITDGMWTKVVEKKYFETKKARFKKKRAFFGSFFHLLRKLPPLPQRKIKFLQPVQEFQFFSRMNLI